MKCDLTIDHLGYLHRLLQNRIRQLDEQELEIAPYRKLAELVLFQESNRPADFVVRRSCPAVRCVK